MFKFLISLQHYINLRRYGPRFCDVGMKGRREMEQNRTLNDTICKYSQLDTKRPRCQASASQCSVRTSNFKAPL